MHQFGLCCTKRVIKRFEGPEKRYINAIHYYYKQIFIALILLIALTFGKAH